jgi:hypothetical protein
MPSSMKGTSPSVLGCPPFGPQLPVQRPLRLPQTVMTLPNVACLLHVPTLPMEQSNGAPTLPTPLPVTFS